MPATQQATQATPKATPVRTLAEIDQLPDSALINEKESRLILGGVLTPNNGAVKKTVSTLKRSNSGLG